MRAGLTACVAAALLGIGTQAGAIPVEETLSVPVAVTDRHGRSIAQPIVVTLFREPGHERYPLLVINHGRAPDPYERGRMGRARFAQAAGYFASLGFAVMVPTRIGYGDSGGADLEESGYCASKHYAPGYEAAAQQVLQVMRAAGERPDVDATRTVVVGQSYGGGVSIALAAKNPPGLRLAVNFAGGAGADPEVRPGEPCSPHLLKALFAEYGETARVPTVWIYAANDRYMGTYPEQWFEAFRAAGGIGQYKAMPPFGRDGHGLFVRGQPVWQPLVAQVLRDAGFHAEVPVDAAADAAAGIAADKPADPRHDAPAQDATSGGAQGIETTK
ncbi:dienelactone hydrolase [Cupriavidus respiraculi]|uniref:alpha/beta hydrolase family protein n=1 Tax=Cupriavidus respiraculi TaxID=195930 RepID=UPI001C9550A8|nr:alpha/beta hydrolase-fold protein [Cupriavidus respiraculi]MBY4946327.1 dienelactone hydrolase [Cupriavidus respiraculi]